MSQRFLPTKEVLARVSLSKTELYRRIKNCTFPAPLRLGAHRVAFLESEVDAWMDQRAAARGEGGRGNG